MSVPSVVAKEVDQEGRWLHRVGGISALAFGIAYIVIIALYVPMGAPPSGAEARLKYVAENTALWKAILGLSVLTDFLLVPVALSLYLALKGINRNAMLLATAAVGLFILLDLAITWTNYAVLITFSANFTAATSVSERAVWITAAQYPSAVLESNLLFVYNTLTLSVGILLTGFVMLKGIFNRMTVYVGIATGIFGIAAVAGSFFVNTAFITIIASTLMTVWILLVGIRLYRLGQH